MKKRMLSIITAVFVMAAAGSGCKAAEERRITVLYDGTPISFDVQPEVSGGRVMVPMRTIFETFGAKVKWDDETQTVTAKRKSKTIVMTIGSTEMTKNDTVYTFDAAPALEAGRTLIPVRAVSELLGLDVSWDEETQTVSITTPADDSDDGWMENTGAADLSALTVSGSGISAEGNVIQITQGGDFEITGALENGQILIDTEEKVKLRLSGMSLTNPNGPALYVKQADKAYITLTENTENMLADGEIYTTDGKACITSKDNLEIKGSGSLTVIGNYNHGIDGSDSIEIGNGTVNVTAKNDGIHANDTLAVSGGVLNITAEGDGLQADEIIDITGGALRVTTTGEIPAAETFGGPGFFGGMNGTDPSQMTGEERQAMREQMQKQLEEAQQQEAEADGSEDVTSKGIKAGWMLDISGGDIEVNATDHAVHSASELNIKGGAIQLYSEVKKGISAHGNVTIDDGSITVAKATEGIESKQILTVNGGTIRVTASDDGFNAGGNGMMEPGGGMGGRGGWPQGAEGEDVSGGAQSGRMTGGPQGMTGEPVAPPDETGGAATPPDQSGMPQMGQGGPGGFGGSMNSAEISSEHHIQINGGDVYIQAGGDGLDSNGSMVIAGGTVTVDCTAAGGNNALDPDGAFLMTGGELTAVGPADMVEAPNSYSTQNVLKLTLTERAEEGKTIEIKASDGAVILSHTPVGGFQSLVYSSAKLESGQSYTVLVDGAETEGFTVSETVTSVGTASRGMGGFGGGRGARQQPAQTQE